MQLLKHRKFHFSLLLAIFVVTNIVAFFRSQAVEWNDFEVYYRASRSLASTPTAVYSDQLGPYAFRYAPPCLALIQPLILFGKSNARALWFLVQLLEFVGGLFFLRKSIQILGYPSWIVPLSAFVGLRYYIDAQYAGQVFGLLFIGWAAGLYYSLREKHFHAGVALSLPVLLKIGPGLTAVFVLIQALRTKKTHALRFIAGGVTSVLILGSLSSLLGRLSVIDPNLWKSWGLAVVTSSHEFNGATTRSQSFRSFLLRLMSDAHSVESIWLWALAAAVSLILASWCFSRLSKGRAFAAHYGLSIIAYTLLMPESLPYAFVALIIPIALIFGQITESHPIQTSRTQNLFLGQAAILIFVLTCSLPGTDIVGSDWTEAIQRLSVPMFATALLGLALAWKIKIPGPAALFACRSRD